MKLAHITIQSADLEASVEFYSRCAGLRVIRDMRDRPENRIVFIDAQKPYKGSGVSMGFEVDDVAASREWFVSEGYKPTEIRWIGEGRGFFFVPDPSGFSVQFISK